MIEVASFKSKPSDACGAEEGGGKGKTPKGEGSVRRLSLGME